ncbi:MarR family winged helix-turn-helix transcriptional regulator [Lactiplantibacillus daowaiensis]|uniref:MarR family winged helix-turn-helix transcriptional regulator n=1 Tax=Lactiplantibacillus daowaiensis TaxID=2559918 RepID=A0ABW1RX14_9LACO|nr:MarR family winged helix-turn-helix transcriptional regulator [Lactiplantibacillus daowaiensis]
MLDPQTTILFRVRNLSLSLDKYVKKTNAVFNRKPISKLQGMAAGYLFQHRDQEIHQRDLEQAMGISKSTASGLVSRMVKNGVIVTAPATDVRYKRIFLTKASIQEMATIDAAAQKMEATLSHGVSDADLATFFKVMAQIQKNTE